MRQVGKHILELSEQISEIVCESPMLVVLGDINIHIEAVQDATAQNLLASITTMDVSWVISGPTQHTGQTLVLEFFLTRVYRPTEIKPTKDGLIASNLPKSFLKTVGPSLPSK